MPHVNREERNAYHRAYYSEHKAVLNAKAVAINKRRLRERRKKLQELKSQPCMACGRSFPYYVMDYDHRDPSIKTTEISKMVTFMVAWETVLVEIAKCDLICTNCHRLRTYHGNNSYKTVRFRHQRLVLDELKSTTPCRDCMEFFQPCQMDFDHIGVSAKVNTISQMMGKPTEDVATEIRKCHLVCANCHRIRGNTSERVDDPNQGDVLAQRFLGIAARIPVPLDERYVPFPLPHLLGVVRDKELSEQTGFSKAMVGWYRRKAGIKLGAKGKRVTLDQNKAEG